MITTPNGQQATANVNRNFVNLKGFRGTGETGFSRNVTGILLGIEPRDGSYEFTTDDGEKIVHSQTWTAYFESGAMFSWPTYVDKETGEVKMWSRFSSDIDLGECVEQRIPIHVWRDERNWVHLEIAKQTTTRQQPQMQQPTQPQQYYPQQYQQQYYQPQMQQPGINPMPF